MNEWHKGWFTGFVDGEGSFIIGIWKHPKMKLGVGLKPEFGITLHKKDLPVLEKIADNLKIGKISKHTDNSVQWRVNDFKGILKLVDFFEQNKLSTTKLSDFEIWKSCIMKIKNSEHLTKKGILDIIKLRDSMKQTKRRRTSTIDEIEKWIRDIPLKHRCKICNSSFPTLHSRTIHKKRIHPKIIKFSGVFR